MFLRADLIKVLLSLLVFSSCCRKLPLHLLHSRYLDSGGLGGSWTPTVFGVRLCFSSFSAGRRSRNSKEKNFKLLYKGENINILFWALNETVWACDWIWLCIFNRTAESVSSAADVRRFVSSHFVSLFHHSRFPLQPINISRKQTPVEECG